MDLKFQTNGRIEKKWTPIEDEALIIVMMDLYQKGTHNADTGFKAGYLGELEKMIDAKLPNCGIKAKPHIESMIKTLKKEWSIVYDMVYGSHTSDFG
ncbi:hypothetical protein Cni_G10370 [Canna indica]|uniref:Myb/SANT-like domain-containing protein n=1 Tax=Canna indica TaxID=4628 RepID=A0AAQ3K441_9LILI|nr:hypothetical protein Cni_G10370 [Canna indica]